MNNKAISYWVWSIILLIIQVFLLRDFSIWGRGFFFLHLYIIIKSPLNLSLGANLILAFVSGWVVDLFLLSYGLHAFSGVLLAFLKFPILRIVGFDRNQETETDISIQSLKLEKFFFYIFISILIYSLIYFFLEASDLSLLGIVLFKIIFTSFLTSIVFMLIENFSTSK